MMQTLLAIFIALVNPQEVQHPPDPGSEDSLRPKLIIIRDVEGGVLSLPGSMKWSIELVKTEVGSKFRITSEELIIEASQLQIKATAKAGEPILITGLEKTVVTIKPVKNIRFDSVKTSNGPRIQFTINDSIKLDTIQAVTEYTSDSTTRVTTFKIPDMVPITFDTQILPSADSKTKQR